jgi:hypothetical protein
MVEVERVIQEKGPGKEGYGRAAQIAARLFLGGSIDPEELTELARSTPTLPDVMCVVAGISARDYYSRDGLKPEEIDAKVREVIGQMKAAVGEISYAFRGMFQIDPFTANK